MEPGALPETVTAGSIASGACASGLGAMLKPLPPLARALRPLPASRRLRACSTLIRPDTAGAW